MTFTVSTISEISSTNFDAMWNDCKASIIGKTFPMLQETSCRETIFNGFNAQPIKLKIAKDGTDVCILSGTEDSNRFNITLGLHGNDADGSKAWLYSADYWTAIKNHLLSESLTAYGGEMMKDQSAYNHVVAVANSNLYPNANFMTENESSETGVAGHLADFTKITVWFNHA